MSLLMFCLDIAVHYWKWSVKLSNYYYRTVSLSILSMFDSFIWGLCHLVHIFWDNYFLMNWPFYHYIMNFFASWNKFDLKTILPDISMTSQLSFGYCIWDCLSHLFTLNLFVSLALKWVSCRQYIVDHLILTPLCGSLPFDWRISFTSI